jgi:hypothetical protein
MEYGIECGGGCDGGRAGSARAAAARVNALIDKCTPLIPYSVEYWSKLYPILNPEVCEALATASLV